MSDEQSDFSIHKMMQEGEGGSICEPYMVQTIYKDGKVDRLDLPEVAARHYAELVAERNALKAERDEAVAMKDALVGDKIMLRSELAAVEAERDRLAVTLGTMTARAKMAMRCQDDRFNFGWIVEEADAALAKLEKEKTNDQD